MTPLNDSVKLLQEEIEREEQRVEMKRKELAKLEKESKVASKTRKHRAAKVCFPVLRALWQTLTKADISIIRRRQYHENSI
jgi:hypothetical protein